MSATKSAISDFEGAEEELGLTELVINGKKNAPMKLLQPIKVNCFGLDLPLSLW